MADPWTTPPTRGLWLVQATLRVVVAVQCFGMAGRWLTGGKHSHVGELLLNVSERSPDQVQSMEMIAACVLLAIGISTLWRPSWLVLIPVALWAAANSWAPVIVMESRLAVIEPIEHAVRVVAPLSLALIDLWPPTVRFSLGRVVAGVWLMRIAAALTFFGHGTMALFQAQDGGHFVDLITTAGDKLLNRAISEATAADALLFIGAVDFAVALNLLLTRNRKVALYMALWGFMTAASRVIYFGPAGYHETLIRIANGGVPLAIFLFWVFAVKEQKAYLLPELIVDAEDPPHEEE